MTLPIDTILPLHTDLIRTGQPQDLERYLRELIFTLQQIYTDIAQGINGEIRANFLEPGRLWIPIIKDTANPNTTFTYDHQIGWVFRQGLLVDAWFDVEWTANVGAITGNMYIELPYIVANTQQKPFVGILQPSNLAYTGGTECVINAIGDTYRGEVWNCGSGFITSNQSSTALGQLIGHIRYIGVQDEA